MQMPSPPEPSATAGPVASNPRRRWMRQLRRIGKSSLHGKRSGGFAMRLSRPGFLSDQTRQEMFHSPGGNYALGCYVGTIGKQRLIAHGGGFDGFSAYLGILPDSDLCAIVLSNIEQTRAIDLCQAILRSCTGEAVAEEEIPEPVDYIAPPRVVTAEELGRYAGEYQSELGVLKIAVDGDHLTLQGGGDPKPEPLVPGDKRGMFQIQGGPN